MENEVAAIVRVPPDSLNHKMIVRIHSKARQRLVEWLASAQMALLGWILLGPEQNFVAGGAFESMMSWATENEWGYFIFFTGIGGLIALIINGAMENITPWARTIRAIFGLIVFSMIVNSILIQAWIEGHPMSTGLAMYLPAAVLEVVSISLAVRDARIYRDGRRNVKR